jgi:hypothetical protein
MALEVRKHKEYVWTRYTGSGRFEMAYGWKSGWGVFDDEVLVFGHIVNGSNTNPGYATCTRKKDALEFIRGFEAAREHGEWEAYKLKRGDGLMQKSFRAGVLRGIKESKEAK